MKIGRNEPCPCGSGKKYKKCCLNKDLDKKDELKATKLEALSSGSPEIQQLRDDHVKVDDDRAIEVKDEVDLLWEDFEKSDLKRQVELFKSALDNAELMDDELAFSMIDQVYLKSVNPSEKKEVITLIEMLHEKLPDVFQENAAYHIHWLLSCALVTHQMEKVVFWAPRMSECAAEDIDVFYWVADKLAYHGCLSILLSIMRNSWKDVEESDDIMPSAIGEFSVRAGFYEIFDYIQTTSPVNPDDPELMKRIAVFGEFEQDRLTRYVNVLSEVDSRSWNLDDFEGKASSAEIFRENVFNLCLEFSGYAQREFEIPYPRALMGAREICNYLVERITGELKPKRSKKSRNRKEEKKQHPLCPDYTSLNSYFAQHMHFMNPQSYLISATFELIPNWLKFLKKHQLIEQEMINPTLMDLAPIADDLTKLWKNHHEDPALLASLDCWKDIKPKS